MSVDGDTRHGEASGSNTQSLREDHPMGDGLGDRDIEVAALIASRVRL